MFKIKNKFIEKDQKEYINWLLEQVNVKKSNMLINFVIKLSKRNLQSAIDFLDVFFEIDDQTYKINRGLESREKRNLKRAEKFVWSKKGKLWD